MPGVSTFRRRVGLLGEDTPQMRKRIGQAGEVLAQEIRGGGGSVARNVVVNEPKAKGGQVRVRVAVLHRAGKVREFGRTKWYRSPSPGTNAGIGNNRAGSKRKKGVFKSKGQPYNRRSVEPRPFVGVKSGGYAIGRADPQVRELLTQGMNETWADILQGLS